MKKNLKTVINTIACAIMIAGSAMTVCAEEPKTEITQVTPGGVNIYGYEMTSHVDPMTRTRVSKEWSPVYIAAIDAAGITNEMSDYDKAVAIANYLCNALEYDHALAESESGLSYIEESIDQNGDVALTKGSGVCGHYADAFEDLCRMVNIECYTVHGTAGGGFHGWNEIHINGTTYYTDVTWLDTTKNSEYLMSQTEWSDHQRVGTNAFEYTQEYIDAYLSGGVVTIYTDDPAGMNWQDDRATLEAAIAQSSYGGKIIGEIQYTEY